VRGIETEDVGRYEQEVLAYLRAEHADILAGIREGGTLSDENEQKLIGALDAFADIFQGGKSTEAA
jgi:F-type H+-transporting ATPase subunit alpha